MGRTALQCGYSFRRQIISFLLLTAWMAWIPISSEAERMDYQSLYAAARLKYKEGDWPGAQGSFNSAIQEQPKSDKEVLVYGRYWEVYLPFYFMGMCHYHLGETRQALDAWNIAEAEENLDEQHRQQIRLLRNEIRATAWEALSTLRARKNAIRSRMARMPTEPFATAIGRQPWNRIHPVVTRFAELTEILARLQDVPDLKLLSTAEAITEGLEQYVSSAGEVSGSAVPAPLVAVLSSGADEVPIEWGESYLTAAALSALGVCAPEIPALLARSRPLGGSTDWQGLVDNFITHGYSAERIEAAYSRNCGDFDAVARSTTDSQATLESSYLQELTTWLRLASSEESYVQSRALLIGASEYRGEWPKLKPPLEQLETMKNVLGGLGFETIDILANPSQTDLESTIDALTATVAKGRSRLFIYYTGHGQVAENSGAAYLVPIDATSTAPGDTAQLVAIDTIMARLRASSFRHTMTVLDSCFSGNTFFEEQEWTSEASGEVDNVGHLVVAAGGKDRRVLDSDRFRQNLIDGLKGSADLNLDGIVEGAELATFLQQRADGSAASGEEPTWRLMAQDTGAPGEILFPNLISHAPPGQLLREYLQQDLEAWRTLRALTGKRQRQARERYLDDFPNGVFANLARALPASR